MLSKNVRGSNLEDGIVVIPEWSKKTGQTLMKLEKDRDYKRDLRKGIDYNDRRFISSKSSLRL